MSGERRQKVVDAVAEATRNGLGKVMPEQLDSGWQRLESALSDGRYPSVPMVSAPARWWLRGFALTAAALALGFASYRLLPLRPASPLHYVLEGATLGPGETIKAEPAVPAKLSFSDTSQIRISPAAKLSVLSLDAHGSRIALADGELDVQVQHRPGSSWRFEAGPFTVQVRGTEFHLAYAAERGRFALQMVTGAVEVRSRFDDRVLNLRAGESLELFAGAQSKPAAPAVVRPAAAETSATAKSSAEAAPPLPTRISPSSARHRASPAERASAGPEAMVWASLIAQGDFAGVVEDAERRGLEATLASASAAELTSLADAARYTRHNDLARQALLGVRARFPGTARAGDAAFFLGRLAEQPASSPSSSPGSASGAALAWYETYLRESERGPFAGEALGREIAMLAHTDRSRAQRAAQIYLERFPQGTQAELAKSLLESPVR